MSGHDFTSYSLKRVLVCAAIFVSTSVNASSNSCKNVQLSPNDDTQLHFIAYAEPEFAAPKISSKTPKKTKSEVSLFSWLTESHSMPSLHFIDLIEIFGTDNEQQ